MGKPRPLDDDYDGMDRIRSHATPLNPQARTWMLYWRDRNRKWRLYERLAPVKNLELIFAELDRDPTGIFLG